MRYVTLDEVLELHRMVIDQSGGASGVRDWKALDAAVSAPEATFEGKDLYPTLLEKAAALGFLLIANHPFLDGNKRVGHAAMEAFLVLNGQELHAEVDEQEAMVLGIAAGRVSQAELLEWLRSRIVKRGRA